MKKIKLTQGKFALVDDADFEWLNQWKWYYHKKGYVGTNLSRKLKLKNKGILMHALIMNPSKGMMVDHINGNRLDNRRTNLRICTNAENVRNQKKRKDNTSGYKGVSWHKQNKKWQVGIGIHGKRYSLGTYVNSHIAAIMYDFWAKELFGEFANTNFNVITYK